jgi:hypothetical protein
MRFQEISRKSLFSAWRVHLNCEFRVYWGFMQRLVSYYTPTYIDIDSEIAYILCC